MRLKFIDGYDFDMNDPDDRVEYHEREEHKQARDDADYLVMLKKLEESKKLEENSI